MYNSAATKLLVEAVHAQAFCYLAEQGSLLDIQAGTGCTWPEKMRICASTLPALWGTNAWLNSHGIPTE